MSESIWAIRELNYRSIILTKRFSRLVRVVYLMLSLLSFAAAIIVALIYLWLVRC